MLVPEIPGVFVRMKNIPVFSKLNGTKLLLKRLNQGKDCDPVDSKTYPGRNTNSIGTGSDYNCNGILGVDVDGVEYKEKFCKNSG